MVPTPNQFYFSAYYDPKRHLHEAFTESSSHKLVFALVAVVAVVAVCCYLKK